MGRADRRWMAVTRRLHIPRNDVSQAPDDLVRYYRGLGSATSVFLRQKSQCFSLREACESGRDGLTSVTAPLKF